MPTVELEIPSRSPYVGVVRLAMASLARSAGFDEEAVDDLKIAVSEACANSVLSNEEAGVTSGVNVTWELHDDRLVIEVADRGNVYDPDGPPQEDSQGFHSRWFMSVALLQSLVDDSEFVPRDGGGMIARLIFTR